MLLSSLITTVHVDPEQSPLHPVKVASELAVTFTCAASLSVRSCVNRAEKSSLGISLFGVFGLFGIFGSIILILLVANLVGGRSRSHGDPSGLGIALGFGLFFILTVAIDAALG